MQCDNRVNKNLSYSRRSHIGKTLCVFFNGKKYDTYSYQTNDPSGTQTFDYGISPDYNLVKEAREWWIQSEHVTEKELLEMEKKAGVVIP